MQNPEIDQVLSEWAHEFNLAIGKSSALCVALFDADRKLLFATPVMHTLFKGDPYSSFINPTFDQLLEIKSADSLIFEGLLTIGDYTSINSSIVAHIFLREGRLLVVGGADTVQLIDQNTAMYRLNHQVNNLQRQLLKEKYTLENTLNQLNETNSVLQQTLVTKDKFFSIIAHDLKSPFNSIIGFSEILIEQIQKNNFERIEEISKLILQSSQRTMALILNLMEWAQLQTGRMEFKPEQFDMVSFVNESTLLYDYIALEKSINIKRFLPQNVTMSADKAMINTVFRNLISNAIKFTMPGGEITISSAVKPGEIIFSIRDTGVGIPQNCIERIFKIEQNYSTSGTNKEKGTGLGLILCKEFVEKHNGRIWVESEKGVGSIFYFTLPYSATAGIERAGAG